MYPTVKLFSNTKNDIFNFLRSFYSSFSGVKASKSQNINSDYNFTFNASNDDEISGYEQEYSKQNHKKGDLNSDSIEPEILEWKKEYQNPIEIADILGTFIENDDKFDIVMWISLDKGAYIKITPNNADSIIRYLYERYPY